MNDAKGEAGRGRGVDSKREKYRAAVKAQKKPLQNTSQMGRRIEIDENRNVDCGDFVLIFCCDVADV